VADPDVRLGGTTCGRSTHSARRQFPNISRLFSLGEKSIAKTGWGHGLQIPRPESATESIYYAVYLRPFRFTRLPFALSL